MGEARDGWRGCLPVVVDLPESTWPITTMLMWRRSSLLFDAESAAVPVERGWMETEISWRWRDASTRLVGDEGKKKDVPHGDG